MIRLRLVIAALSLLCLLFACNGKKNHEGSSPRPVVVAVEGDIDSFNPLFVEELSAGEVNDLLFPALVGSDFNARTGVLDYTPLLARSWEYGNGGKDITFHLVGGAHWSDGDPVKARDVQFSYELYGDPDVASIRQAAVEQLRLTNGKPDITRSIEIVDDSTVVFHFERTYPGQLFDAGLPIIPVHVFKNVPRKELRTSPLNRTPASSGPFVLARWTPLQETILNSNPQSNIPYPAKLSQLIFRVVPDYRARVMQLQTGELDVVAGLRTEDAEMIEKQAPTVSVVSTPGRDYDFIGWNNIDPAMYASSGGKTIRPHKLFGNRHVRRALTMAVNREEIVAAYLGKHGQPAMGGVSPLFKWAYNDSLKPLPFDVQQARALLKKEGWHDSDGDGVIDRHDVRFSFALKVPSGNQLRNVIAATIQQQLRNIGIEMQIEQVEKGTFWEEVTTRKYDAWLAGFSVPLQMQLDDLWGSDLQKYPFNLTGFRNARVDQLLASARSLAREVDGADLWKEFQVILHDEQPCTFLYWINSIVGVNTRVKGTNVGVLGTTHKAWEWYVGEGGPNVVARTR